MDDALNLVGLGTFARAYPRQLSGGMAQRVALARALVNDPSLLCSMSRWPSSIRLTRIAMQAELIRLWQETGFTGLLVTHDVEALFLAERVIVFSDRPASVKSEVVVDRPTRATAGTRTWPNCAAASWKTSASPRRGRDEGSIAAASLQLEPGAAQRAANFSQRSAGTGLTLALGRQPASRRWRDKGRVPEGLGHVAGSQVQR